MLSIRFLPLFSALILAGCVATGETKTYSSDPHLTGMLCVPEGAGPFPVAVFNHGGLGNIIGGAPYETCSALAKAGYIGFSPIRRQTRPLFGHLNDVAAGIEYAKSYPKADPGRLGLLGFSRGGMLTYQTLTRRNDVKVAVIMAAATGPRGDALTSQDASTVNAPVLALVAANDTGSRTTMNRDTLVSMKEMVAALKEARKEVTFIIYPPHPGDGHQLFFSINDYWKDVTAFLDKHLKQLKPL